MNTIKDKQNSDFYMLLNSLSISELESFIGETEETGLAYALSVDFFYDILESENDFLNESNLYIKHVKKTATPIMQSWKHAKSIEQDRLYKEETLFVINDDFYSAAA